MAGKTEKGGKFRYVNCRTWNMARKVKIMENEKHPLDDLKNGTLIPAWEAEAGKFLSSRPAWSTE